MIRDYLPPTDYSQGGSSFEEMEASRRYEEYRERISSAPEAIRPMLESEHALVRGIGAVGAVVHEAVVGDDAIKTNAFEGALESRHAPIRALGCVGVAVFVAGLAVLQEARASKKR